MKTISTTLKNAFEKDNIVERDYIILTGTTDRIYLWFKYYDDCYKDGNIVQNFIMKRIEFDYADNDVDFKQKEFKAYKEYKLEDGNWEVIDYGTFIVADIEQSDTKESVKITAYDCALKFANPYVTDLNYASGNITVLDVLYECCTKCGVETDLTSFTNSDFIVDSNQFGDTAQFGNVISAIAGISGNFAKIIGDKLTLKFTNETDEIIESKNYEEFEDKRDTHPITIVGLGISNIEGENVVQRWEEGVAEYGENYMMINDNPFAYTQEKRQQLLPALYNKLKGFAYSSMTLKNCLKPYYECGDLVKVKNKDGNLVDTIILRTSLEGVACNFEAPSITKANVEYANQADALTIAKRTEIEVDKQQGQITSVVQQQDETSSKLAQQQADINGVKTNIENEVNGLNTKYNAITADVNQFKVDVGQKNGNNLLRNSAMKSGTDYWLKEPIQSYYSGDEPPENPTDNMYWYCTQDKNEFERGIFYQYINNAWNKTNATKEYFGGDNLLANVSATENELARQNTISGTIITINGGGLEDVTHVFAITAPVDINIQQDYLTLSYLFKNFLQLGVAYIGVAFLPLHIEDVRTYANESPEAIYEEGVVITPDDYTDTNHIQATIKIPKKEDVINVMDGTEEPEDTTQYWLDINNPYLGILKQYNAENQMWEQSDKINTVCANTDGYLWVYRAYYDGYYKTKYKIDDFIPKVAYVFITAYPSMDFMPSTIEPTPNKGMYWGDTNENGTVKRAKYNGTEFVEWQDLGLPTALILANPLPVPPYPKQYAIPVAGIYEIADLKLEYGKIATIWTCHAEEMYGKNLKFDTNGLRVTSAQNNMFIDEDEITSTYKDKEVFSIKKDLATFEKIAANNAKIAGVEIVQQSINGDDYLIEY